MSRLDHPERMISGAVRCSDDAHPLSPRQCEIIPLLALPIDQIAWRMGVCRSTVKAHIRGLLDKLEVGNRESAVALLSKAGVTFELLPLEVHRRSPMKGME